MLVLKAIVTRLKLKAIEKYLIDLREKRYQVVTEAIVRIESY
jgi:hypothetical protein